MQIDDTLRQLGQAMGLGPLKLDANGICRLNFQGDLTADLEHVPSREALFVHAVVGRAPAANTSLPTDMLAANLFGASTGGGTLAIDAGRNEVMLWREFPEAGLDAHKLGAALELFLRALEDWRGKLARGGDSTTSQDTQFDPYAIRA